MNKFVVLLFSLLTISSLVASQPTWTVNQSQYQHSMTITATISIEGVESTDTDDMVGAFINQECRGVSNMIYVPELDRYLAFLMVYSNASAGDTVSFRIYNAAMDSIFILSEEILFGADQAIGTPENPFLFAHYTPSSDAEFLNYSFSEQTGGAAIDMVNHIIDIEVYATANLTELVADFTLSTGASCFVSTTLQISGETANDFSDTLSYLVVAEDQGTSQLWRVVVNLSANLNNECVFLNYSFPEQTGPALIDTLNRIVSIQVEQGTNLSNLVATYTLSNGSEAYVNSLMQESGITSNNFSYPIIYTVIAEDGVTFKNWIIDVSIAPELNNETDILAFSLPNQVGASIINTTDHFVSINLEEGTDPTDLVALFELSFGATAEINNSIQVSGSTANNFTYPLIYTILAEDGIAEQNWIIEANVLLASSDSANIHQFVIFGQVGETIIDTTNQVVNIKVPVGTDRSSLIASFVLSQGATARIGNALQQSGITVNDYTLPLLYEVMAENSSIKNWIVLVQENTSVNEILSNASFNVYPNLTSGILNIKADRKATYVVNDLLGKTILYGELNAMITTIDLSAEKNGTYFLRIISDNNSLVKRIVLKK